MNKATPINGYEEVNFIFKLVIIIIQTILITVTVLLLTRETCNYPKDFIGPLPIGECRRSK